MPESWKSSSCLRLVVPCAWKRKEETEGREEKEEERERESAFIKAWHMNAIGQKTYKIKQMCQFQGLQLGKLYNIVYF